MASIDGNTPLPVPILTNYRASAIHLEKKSHEMLNISEYLNSMWSNEKINLRLQSHLQGSKDWRIVAGEAGSFRNYDQLHIEYILWPMVPSLPLRGTASAEQINVNGLCYFVMVTFDEQQRKSPDT